MAAAKKDRELRFYVHVVQDDGSSHIYGPGDEDSIGEADLAKIGDHCWIDPDEVVEDDVDPDAPAIKTTRRRS